MHVLKVLINPKIFFKKNNFPKSILTCLCFASRCSSLHPSHSPEFPPWWVRRDVHSLLLISEKVNLAKRGIYWKWGGRWGQQSEWGPDQRVGICLLHIYMYVYIHVYACGWFMLIYGRNQHNIVKQLSTSKKIKNKKSKELGFGSENYGGGACFKFFPHCHASDKGRIMLIYWFFFQQIFPFSRQ